jgi:hypothetical protein
MTDVVALGSRVPQRDGSRCQVCGTSARPVLAIHHVIPVALGGRDIFRNLTTLCANCHRIVHWLSAGNRSVEAHAYGLGQSPSHARRLLALARRIRSRRVRVVGPDLVLTNAVPLRTAINTIVRRNGFDGSEKALLLRRCLTLALRKIAAPDRKACAVRLVRGARFISVDANNYLANRAPAWSDRMERYKEDMMLVWPHRVRPSIMTPSRFRRASAGRFKLIPYTTLNLTWQECLSMSNAIGVSCGKRATMPWSGPHF